MTRNSNGRRGSVLVEFALLFPVLASILFGAMQFGYAFYTYNNLEKAVRDGVRYASLRTYESASFGKNVPGAYLNEVRSVVVYGQPVVAATPVVSGLTTAMVDVTMIGQNGSPNSVTVSINSYTMSLPLSSVTLTNKPATTFRFLGRFTPP